MNHSVLFAFVHHVAGFALVGALASELALFNATPSLQRARILRRAYMTYGISAGVLLVAGLLRVFYFEQGGSYYFQNLFVILKLTLFATIGLLSIYPTVVFLFGKATRGGGGPSNGSERSFCLSWPESSESLPVRLSWPAESATSPDRRLQFSLPARRPFGTVPKTRQCLLGTSVDRYLLGMTESISLP